MGNAAVPAYLGADFSQASPGLRFGLFLPLWEADSYTVRTDSKRAAWNSVKALTPADLKLMRALAQRQASLAADLAEQGCLLALDALAVAPFATGLGNAHPLENGFAFLNPYGLPYLPGSGVKGVLRQAARELADHRWGDEQGWTEEAIEALFGTADTDGDSENGGTFLRGALTCWDVLPQMVGDKLLVEVMTPHQTHYYQKGATPHDSGQPNPINFLTVPPGSKFAFYAQCDGRLLARRLPGLGEGDKWQDLLRAAFSHAFEWLGFGAKTAVGYGAMKPDAIALAQRTQDAQQRRDATRDQAERERQALMTPEELEVAAAAKGLAEFCAQMAAAKRQPYKAGSAFDEHRNTYLKRSLALADKPARKVAAAALRESYKFTLWPGKKERKQEVQAWLEQLDGPAL